MAPTSVFDYQLEHFDPLPDEELICSICRCVFYDPVECPCRHVYCRRCITQWLTWHKNCPACRQRVARSNLQDVVPIIRNMIMKLTLHCKNSERGCINRCTVELYESHLKTCGYELIGCTNSSCGIRFLRLDKETHENFECEFRSIVCDKCSMRIMRSSYLSHDCIKELMRLVKEKDAKIAELEKETDILRREIEERKNENKNFEEEALLNSSDISDFGSMSALSVSSSSNNEDTNSDVESYSLRIYSVINPSDGFSLSANVINDSQNVDSSAQELNVTDEFMSVDYTTDPDGYSKSPTPDILDSFQFSPYQGSTPYQGTNLQTSNSTPAEAAAQPVGRSLLKRRMAQATETAGSLNQSSMLSSPNSVDEFYVMRRQSMSSYPDAENSRALSPDAVGNLSYSTFQGQNGRRAPTVNETIDISDSSSDEQNSSNAYATAASSSNAFSESSQNSSSHVSQSDARSKHVRNKVHKRPNRKASRSLSSIKISCSKVPRSRIPLLVGNPGSSSTPESGGLGFVPPAPGLTRIFRGENSSNQEMTDLEGFALTNTLLLLGKYADKESDPDWSPTADSPESDARSHSVSSPSPSEDSIELDEILNVLSPAYEETNEAESSVSSSSNSENWTTDLSSETDSSYEVEVPPTAWDLMQRYCGDDNVSDCEWIPHPVTETDSE